ncbi:hypothetical protein, partial [Klebsiella pneumoniae]|uniref:hypothetical protein n=1 Tax=Klebsiella pneumoniae TaxID=573 RepID=UPI0019D6F2B7
LQNCICFYPRTRVYNRITSKVHQNYITFTSDRGCTTELHQKYITFTSFLRIKSTSLLRHFYIIFTSDLTSELFVHTPPLPGPPARAENGFSGCAGNALRPRNKLRIRCASVHRYRGGSWWLSGRSSDFSR